MGLLPYTMSGFDQDSEINTYSIELNQQGYSDFGIVLVHVVVVVIAALVKLVVNYLRVYGCRDEGRRYHGKSPPLDIGLIPYTMSGFDHDSEI